jgi:integrase
LKGTPKQVLPINPAILSASFITHQSFTTKLKQWLSKAGLDPSLFSGHSFRRGGASYLYSIGGSTLMVQVMGDWRSQVFTRYLYLTMEDRQQAQSLMKSSINNTIGCLTLSPDVLP